MLSLMFVLLLGKQREIKINRSILIGSNRNFLNRSMWRRFWYFWSTFQHPTRVILSTSKVLQHGCPDSICHLSILSLFRDQFISITTGRQVSIAQGEMGVGLAEMARGSCGGGESGCRCGDGNGGGRHTAGCHGGGSRRRGWFVSRGSTGSMTSTFLFDCLFITLTSYFFTSFPSWFPSWFFLLPITV